MNKYEVYQVGKLPPLTIVEADDWTLTLISDKENHGERLLFSIGDTNVAVFNWNNIAGFKELESEEIK